MGTLKPIDGEIKINDKTLIGYYAQEHEIIDNSKTILNNFNNYGLADCADYLFDFFSLCTLEKIAYCWEALKVNEADFLKIEATPDGGVKNIWGCSKWVPFACSADGHFLCMDFSPAKNGTYGQVITFWYNSPERELIALSFKDFIVEYTKNIQNGVYVYQQEDGCGSIVRKDGEPMF